MVVVLLFVDLKIQLFIEKLLFFQLNINAFPIFFQGWETLAWHSDDGMSEDRPPPDSIRILPHSF
jgi:hypothetical protein